MLVYSHKILMRSEAVPIEFEAVPIEFAGIFQRCCNEVSPVKVVKPRKPMELRSHSVDDFLSVLASQVTSECIEWQWNDLVAVVQTPGQIDLPQRNFKSIVVTCARILEIERQLYEELLHLALLSRT